MLLHKQDISMITVFSVLLNLKQFFTNKKNHFYSSVIWEPPFLGYLVTTLIFTPVEKPRVVQGNMAPTIDLFKAVPRCLLRYFKT